MGVQAHLSVGCPGHGFSSTTAPFYWGFLYGVQFPFEHLNASFANMLVFFRCLYVMSEV